MEFADRAPASVSDRLEPRSCRLANCSRRGRDRVASSRALTIPGRRGRRRRPSLIALIVQEQLEVLANFLVVLNDQDRSTERGAVCVDSSSAACARRSGGEGTPLGVSGTSIENTDPFPRSERTRIGWPSSSPRLLTIERPRPRPWLRWRAGCPLDGIPRRSPAARTAGMPIPVSQISMRSLP